MTESITDPAREIAALIDHLRGFNPGNPNANPFWKVVADNAGLSPQSAEFVELFSIVRSRLARFEEALNELEGKAVAQDISEKVRSAIQRVAAAFSPQNVGSNWADATTRRLTADDATVLRMFSPTMERYSPLRRLSDDEREAAILAIQDALAEINGAEGLEVWQRQALRHGYQRLELILKYFEFFGHEGLVREVVITAAATTAAIPEKSNRRHFPKMWAAAVVVSRIIEVVAAPSTGYHALLDYERALQIGSAKIHTEITPSQLRLAGPTKPAASDRAANEAASENDGEAGPSEG